MTYFKFQYYLLGSVLYYQYKLRIVIHGIILHRRPIESKNSFHFYSDTGYLIPRIAYPDFRYILNISTDTGF